MRRLANKTSSDRLTLSAVTFLVLVVGGGWYWRGVVFHPGERIDEGTYTDAGRLAAGGTSPYEHGGFLYTPAFAMLWNAGERALGQQTFLIAYRWASLVGFWLLVWAALDSNPWPWPIQGLLCIPLLVSPIFLNAFLCGNATLVVIGPLAWALLLAHRAPLRSGFVLGTVNAFKPLGVAALAVLVMPRKGWRPSRWAIVAALSAAVSAGLWLLIGHEYLLGMLRLTRGRPEEPFNTSLHRVLLAAGLHIPGAVLFLIVLVAALWVARRLPDDPRMRLGLAGACTVVAMPVINPHTFLFTLPVQVLALERAVREWRSPGPATGPLRLLHRPLPRTAVVAAAVFCAHTANGGVSASDLPLKVHGVVIAIPLLAVIGLTWFALGMGHLDAGPSPRTIGAS
ncbi:MAG TPA: glycosyltransferase 87 family protein [Thermoanaerobaculia bacterium]|nr:glycosyltransferase 87 family protein [Thermoanaerobaculia bacterium]